MNNTYEKAVFGGGCFWCTEAIFRRLKGVKSVTPGYAGGTMENPSYEQVSQGNTGHAEVIEIEYDPNIISYSNLLEVFFKTHDPTSKNRQGNDVGTQYRSVVLYANENQRNLAEKAIREIEESGIFDKPVLTEILPLDSFFRAEEYHLEYYDKNPDKPYCSLVIGPKIAKLEKLFRDKINYDPRS
ncbi:peptide-methionine (S)-S-oxide reductase [candidate division WWE3 bacterium]|uniref:Peptide methionine sulfoxide reductase MsrA n=1 Tax=candidate division WWE3 bacterium TaxID=2053526 RepID=A0A3A4ZK29_UNCKA|nr:MAG: peptide-methionine (S)-S-oxide reductase [candidate division WWE3 bacterium]